MKYVMPLMLVSSVISQGLRYYCWSYS